MPPLSNEDTLAALVGALAKLLKKASEDSSVNTEKLIKELTKMSQPSAPVVNIPAAKAPVVNVKVEKPDLTSVAKAVDASTNQMEILRKALLNRNKEWTFEIDRDTSGFIRSIDATPKKKVVN